MTSPAPFFSIVTPVYDPDVDLLRQTIRSVTEQKLRDWELILVDDCSRDERVREVLREAAAADPRIRVIERETNGHIVAASNDGIDAARGEFIALLDHDDLLVPRALRAMKAAHRRRARGGLPLLRRGQGRRAGQEVRPVPQAAVVAGAAARPDVHQPPLRPADRAGA